MSRSSLPSSRRRVLNLVLTHQPADEIARRLAWWREHASEAEVLLAVTNEAADLAAIDHPHKIAVRDARLLTRDHARERQSYTQVFAGAARWLADQPAYSHVHLMEYDHLPLQADFNARQIEQLTAEKADVLGFELARVDGTSHPQYLHHKLDPRFHAYWAAMSRRADRRTVVSMFGTGSLWSRAAFEAVAAVPEPFPVYLELWLPTLAHHLGWRLRNFAGEAACGYIRNLGDLHSQAEAARTRGAWTIHPVKTVR